MLKIVPDIAQSTHGNRNIFADIRNVPTRPHTVLGMFLLAFSVAAAVALSDATAIAAGAAVGLTDASAISFLPKAVAGVVNGSAIAGDVDCLVVLKNYYYSCRRL
jgi:hypothetical protein